MRTTTLVLAAAAALFAAPVTTTADDTEGGFEKLGEVFFEFDSARVEGGTTVIDDVVEWANDNPRLAIVVDGYADPVGPAPYNTGLAMRRADGFKARLVARGIEADRVVLVTYGEDAPRRATHELDRRVTAWGTTAPLHAIVDRALTAGGIAVVWDRPVEATALLAPRPTQVLIR